MPERRSRNHVLNSDQLSEVGTEKAICDHCHKTLWNLKRKAQICLFCDVVVHKKCRVLVSKCEDGKKDEQGSAHVIQVQAQVHAPKSSPSKEPPPNKIEDLDFIKVLGEGGYGKVHLVRAKKDQQEYALKAVSRKKAQEEPDRFMTEIAVMRDTSACPFVVTMTSCFQTPTDFYAAEMSLGLRYLHLCDIIHRDLKVDNILLDAEGHIRITDFGNSKIFFNEKEGTDTPCGTPHYCAPEIHMRNVYGFAVDWWALGLVLFEMATRKYPFVEDINTVGSEELANAIISKPPNIPHYVSEELYSLLDGFLCKDPAKRLGCWPEPGFLSLTRHPFFAGLDWEMGEKKMLPPPYKPDFEEHNDKFEESRLSAVEQEELDEMNQNKYPVPEVGNMRPIQQLLKDDDEQGSAHVIQVRAQVHAPKSSPSKEPPPNKMEDLDFIKVLGEGGYGKVHLVRAKKDQQEYALKAVSRKKAQEEPDRFMTEIAVMRDTSACPFVVTMTSCFQTPTDFYAAEMSLGLRYLHLCDIIHRDLKVDNILLDAEGHIRITDFGNSKIFFNEKEGTNTPCGTPHYCAPEIHMRNVYGFAVDWWALGLVLFEMATRKYPFVEDINTVGSEELANAIISKPPNIPHYVSEELYSLLDGFLCKDPAKRLGCWPEPGFLSLTRHPFFAGLDWEMGEKKMLPPPYKPDFEEHNDKFEESRLSPVEQEELDEMNQNKCDVFECVV
ncbi:atypical protein kinase C-like [Rhinophrynus dorsalis]